MEEIAFIHLVSNDLVSYLLNQGYFSYIKETDDNDTDLFGILAYKVFWIFDYHPRFEYRFVVIPSKDFDDPELMKHLSDFDCGTDIEKFKELTKLK